MPFRWSLPAPGLLLQDLGRPGWAHLGVPPSGALDVDALRLANRLVGNESGAVGLEILLGGLGLIASRSVRVAVTGADALIEVDGRAGPWGESVSIAAGARLTVTALRGGIRSWLAVDGGILAGHDLGSGSTDTLTGLGPEPVAAGMTLRLGRRTSHTASATAVPRPPLGDVTRLGVRLGPRDDWLTADSVNALTADIYVVAADSDRVGLRLDAADGSTLHRSRVDELPSEGIVTGAVQVPSGGQPLIFLADHPVTGGYPVVAVVDRADLWMCAQLRPGDRIRFQTASSTASSTPSTPSAPSASRVGRLTLRPAQQRVVVPERSHRSGAGLRSLEANSDPAESRAPDPAVAELVVHDVDARHPSAALSGTDPGVRVRHRQGFVFGVLLVGEQVVLDPVGQGRDADAEEAHAARCVEVGKQRPRHAADGRRPIGRASERRRPGECREVVHPHLEGDRAAGQPRLREAFADAARMTVDDRCEQHRIDKIGVEGVLDRHRLRLAVGDDGSVVLGSGQAVEAGAVRRADDPAELVDAHRLELLDRVHADAPQPLGGCRPDAGDDRYLHRSQQVALRPGRDDHGAVGFLELAGDLRDELRRRDADRCRESAGDVGHGGLEVGGDLLET